MNKNPLLGLEAFGQSVYFDYFRRKALENGELQGLIDQDGLSGLTSNPSIFEKAFEQVMTALQEKQAAVIQKRVTP